MDETEMLSAPDASYMCAEHLDFFRDRLQSMLAELNQRQQTSVVPGNEVMAAADPLDRATMDGERTALFQTQEREARRKADIVAALLRIDSGDYGFCEATGEPIGIPRLLAYPTARLSVEAQQAKEHVSRFGRRAA